MNNPLKLVLAAAVVLTVAAPSHATMPIQKKVKEAGFPATNCLYCHNERLPAKGKVTHSARGEFLVKQKEAKKVKEVDVAWLKDFVEAKK